MLSKKKLLIVDDSDFSRQIISEFLTHSLFDLYLSSDIQDALHNILKFKIDIVLLDIVMPDKNGIELAKEIKNMSPDTQIVFMSSLTQDKMILQVIEAGGFDLLIKPFSQEKLIKTLERIQ